MLFDTVYVETTPPKLRSSPLTVFTDWEISSHSLLKADPHLPITLRLGCDRDHNSISLLSMSQCLHRPLIINFAPIIILRFSSPFWTMYKRRSTRKLYSTRLGHTPLHTPFQSILRPDTDPSMGTKLAPFYISHYWRSPFSDLHPEFFSILQRPTPTTVIFTPTLTPYFVLRSTPTKEIRDYTSDLFSLWVPRSRVPWSSSYLGHDLWL